MLTLKIAFEIAEKNKIPLLFPESLSDRERKDFQGEIKRYKRWHENAQNLSIFTSSVLEEAGINYTFFKTFKPFPYTPSDVNVLLRDESNLDHTIDLLKVRGLRSLNGAPTVAPSTVPNTISI